MKGQSGQPWTNEPGQLDVNNLLKVVSQRPRSWESNYDLESFARRSNHWAISLDNDKRKLIAGLRKLVELAPLIIFDLFLIVRLLMASDSAPMLFFSKFKCWFCRNVWNWNKYNSLCRLFLIILAFFVWHLYLLSGLFWLHFFVATMCSHIAHVSHSCTCVT